MSADATRIGGAGLTGLRDIHVPAGPGVGSLVAAAAAVLVVALIVAMMRRRRRPLRQAALAALSEAEALPPPLRLAAQATLLRRVVRSLAGAGRGTGQGSVAMEAAWAHGEAWLAALDRAFDTGFFKGGAGRAFGDALYRPGGDEGTAAIDATLRRLLGGLRR